MSQQTQTQYFDLITRGIGYANRLRRVTPDKAKGQKFKPFDAISVSALVGENDDVKYVNYDLNIRGEQAKKALEVLKPYLVDADGQPLKDNKVLLGFSIGDAMPDVYFAKNKETGKDEPRVSMKGRLLKITSAKVNGEKIDLPMTEFDEEKAAASAGGDTGSGSDEQ
jgi:hypothetical protein